MAGIELRSTVVASDVSQGPDYELTLLVYNVVQLGQQLADFDGHHRATARNNDRLRPDEYMYAAHGQARLQQLVTIGHVHGLVSYWGETGDAESPLGLPEALRKIDDLSQAMKRSRGENSAMAASLEARAQRLTRFCDCVRKSQYYVQLRRFLREYSLLQHQDGRVACTASLHGSIDRVVLYTRCANQAFLSYLLMPEAAGVGPDRYLHHNKTTAATRSPQHPHAITGA